MYTTRSQPDLHTRPTSLAGSDRVRLETRLVSALILVILLLAFVLLYLWPANTDQLFAWTIKPEMTPLFMGAGYLSGAYFFLRSLFARKWHYVGHGFVAITAFASSMAVATLLHWDRFNHSHPTFVAWLIVYAVTPLLVPFIWWRNRSADSGQPDADDLVVPAFLRFAIGGLWVFELLTGLGLFFWPELAAPNWPWKLTPLTARILGGWFILPGVLGLFVLREKRWSGVRILLQSQVVALFLIFIGVVRAWDNFDKSNPFTYTFSGGTLFALLALIITLVVLDRKRLPRRKA